MGNKVGGVGPGKAPPAHSPHDISSTVPTSTGAAQTIVNLAKDTANANRPPIIDVGVASYSDFGLNFSATVPAHDSTPLVFDDSAGLATARGLARPIPGPAFALTGGRYFVAVSGTTARMVFHTDTAFAVFSNPYGLIVSPAGSSVVVEAFNDSDTETVIEGAMYAIDLSKL